MKPTLFQWRSVVALHETLGGHSHAAAVRLVVLEWLAAGSAEPLVEAVAAGEIDDPILSIVALMLLGADGLDYRLELKPNTLGAPRKPGAMWRDAILGGAHKTLTAKGIGSADAFDAVAEAEGLDHTSIRAAVTRYRAIAAKAKAKPKGTKAKP